MRTENQSKEKGKYLLVEQLIIVLVFLYVGWIFLYKYLAEITGLLEICNSSTWTVYTWPPAADDSWSDARVMLEYTKYIGGIPVSILFLNIGYYFIEKVRSKNNQRKEIRK